MKYYFLPVILFLVSTIELKAQKTDFLNPEKYELKRLSGKINTGNDEMAPAYFRKYKLLVYTSNQKINGKNENQNLFLSKAEDTLWNDPIPLNSYINSKDEEGSFAWSERESKVYFARKVNRNTDIYECEGFIGDSNIYIFSEPQKCAVLNSSYWDSEPSVSKDGLVIYFASDRPGGYGGSDIWESYWDGSKWSIPKNLGEKINSEYDEFSPFIFSDTKELYFSSNRKEGFGKLDFYVSSLHDSGWTYLKNAGELINSSWDELFFFRTGDSSFFSSNRYDKNYDIYIVSPKNTIIQKTEEKTVLCKFNIFNKNTYLPVNKFNIQVEDVVDSKIIKPVMDNLFREQFHFEAKPKHLHKIIINSEEFLDYTEYFLSDSINSEKKILIVPYENVYILNVAFQKNESILSSSSYPALDSAFDLLQKNPDIIAEIGGYTDSQGNRSLNIWVSQLRTDVVRKYLISKGIAPERITAKGYGSSVPPGSSKTDEGRNSNRRVEMKTKRKK